MNHFDITEIEESVKTLIREIGVSKTVYNDRPKSAPNENDFVVVKVSGSVIDRKAFGMCTIGVDLFAKDAKTLKNTAKLSMMYKKLIENLPVSYGRLIFEDTPTIIADASDDYGFHARLININTIIKV